MGRSRATSPPALTRAYRRACSRCKKARALGAAPWTWITPAWLWRLNPHHGPTLEADEYVDSVRLRLGCAPACLASWTRSPPTAPAVPWARPLVATMRSQLSSKAEMEVPGLIPCTDLRPADVLTPALGNPYTALDISICSPHAQQAGSDCTRSRLAAKLDHYGPHLPSLLRQNISNTTLTVCDLSVNPSRAHATLSRPKSYTTGHTTRSRWKYGNGAPGRFARAGPSWTSATLCPCIFLCASPPGSASSCGVPACARPSLFSRILWSFAAMSRSDQLRRRGHGRSWHSLPAGTVPGVHGARSCPVSPRLRSHSRSRSPVPKRAPTDVSWAALPLAW